MEAMSLLISLSLSLSLPVTDPPVKYHKLDHPSSDTEDENEIFVKEDPKESSKKHYTSPYFKEKVALFPYHYFIRICRLFSYCIFYKASH